ncbi:hypothetical protein FC959_03475 [Clostridium botulinum]|nr:hypothetical protein [Clostridium botulinum]
MNFEKDLREQISKLLNKDKITFNKEESTFELLISYLNIINRRISFIPRKVFISDNIQKIIENNKVDKKYIEILLKFKESFENGIDMNGHLSTAIYCSDMSIKDKKASNYRNSRDYLLDDWGIYHIHLSEKEAKNKKEMHCNRSEYLLFVKVINNEVYFIDILNHNEKNLFAKQELLETMDRNWHFILDGYMLTEVESISKLTDNEIDKTRRNGCLLAYKINGKVYTCIGGGLTSAGTNIMHTNYADKILDDMNFIEEYFRDNYMSIKNEVEDITKVKCLNNNLEFKFFLEARGYVVKEINTGYASLYFYEGDYLKKQSGLIDNK